MKRFCSLVEILLILLVADLPAATAMSSRAHVRRSPEEKTATRTRFEFSQQDQALHSSTVRLYGYVTDLNGSPIPQAFVDLYDTTGVRLSLQATDSNGYYEFSVPQQSLYRIIAGSMADQGDYQVFWYIPVAREIRPSDASEVRTDIALRASASLLLQAYDATGSQLRNAAFKTRVGSDVYPTDLADLPRYGWFSALCDAYCRSQGSNWDLAVPAFAVPTQIPMRLHVLWEVPDFGKVILDLDNEGGGYMV